MDQNQLIAFERIVRDGSFSRAGESLGVSQAAISGRIQALEAELGAALFVRGGRGVTLTGAGEVFLPYARRVLTILTEGADAARQAHDGHTGRVSIGAIDSVVDGLLVPVIARYRQAHPQVILSVRTGHTPQIVQDLLDGVVRLGIVTWYYVTGTAGLDVLARLREPLLAVCAPTHPLARRNQLTVAEVVHEATPFLDTPWGTTEDARIAGPAQQGWRSHELPHNLMRRLILLGSGAAFLPASLVAEDVTAGRLVVLPVSDAESLQRELAIVTHAGAGALPPATLDFIDGIRSEAARRGFLS